MRKLLFTLIILAALGTAGWWAYQNFYAPPEEPQAAREEIVVEPGTLLAMVNATGNILPAQQTTLSFRSAGRVAEVLVEEGEAVRAGQALARLETTDLGYAVSQAELALATAQTQLLRLQQGPSAYDRAAAEASLESARASYRRLVAGPTEEEIKIARANLDQAEATLAQAQAAYDQVADRPDVGLLPQSLQLEQATIAYETARANFELATRDPSQAEISAARSAIAQAEAALARVDEGVQAEEIQLAQLQVEQAQLSLDQAHHQLENSVLEAPHDGTITLVGVREGELSGGQPAFILADLSSYHVDVMVDEIDIARVQAGQPVTLTLDALPGTALRGEVAQIADAAQIDTGVVSYKVTVSLSPGDAPLRAGMTANVDIITERREEVLLVPNRFIRIDRTTGQTFVDKLVDGTVQTFEVQTGLRDETYSEVLAGIEAGDIVVLVQASSREELRRAFEMGP
ncbi:MAG TPA: efflux RND transporter periplasmic adaptor subunit [Anaerolineae bacterium]|nr:efflux RND transporter periplasmic adaptor subunit [Anaerolineae bacterium]